MFRSFLIDVLVQTVAIAAVILVYEFLFKGGTAPIPSAGGAPAVGNAIWEVIKRSGVDALAMGLAAALVISLVRLAGGRGK
jgi:hypothetical protein